MVMCKESQGKGWRSNCARCYISHRTNVSPMQRFYTDSVHFNPISVDPTFDLGDFCVTARVYMVVKPQRAGV